MPELWNPEQVAQYLGIAPGSIRRALHRLRVRPVAREPGRAGRNLYDPDQIRAAGPEKTTDRTEQPDKE